MSDSYTNLLYHIVFSSKDRRPLITVAHQLRLYDYIGGTIRGMGGISLELNGPKIMFTYWRSFGPIARSRMCCAILKRTPPAGCMMFFPN